MSYPWYSTAMRFSRKNGYTYGSGVGELHFAHLSSVSLNSLVVGWSVKTITHSNQQAVPITLHKSIYSKSHNDEIMVDLPHNGDNKEVTRLF